MQQEKQEKLDLNNYLLIPTKKVRLRRIAIGRYSRYMLEKQIGVYNLFGPGKQDSKPFMFLWDELSDADVQSFGIDIDKIFELS